MNPLEELATDNARIDRPVVTPRWPVAEDIRLVDGNRLRWQPGDSGAQWVEPSTGLLEHFVELRHGSPDQILQYARRWGVLYLCEHDFPAGHPLDYWPGRPMEAHACPFDERGRLTPRALAWDEYRERQEQYSRRLLDHLERRGEIDSFGEPPPKRPEIEGWEDPRWTDHHYCFPRGFRTDAPWEAIAAWRSWASRAYASLMVTADLRAGKPGAAEDWRTCAGSERWIEPQSVDDGWRQIEHFSNLWLGAARVRPWLTPVNGALRLALGSSRANSPLFGAIAVQLALALCGAEGFAVCDGCKKLHAPARKPRSDERSYCLICRDKGVPQRHASVAYRARKLSRS